MESRAPVFVFDSAKASFQYDQNHLGNQQKGTDVNDSSPKRPQDGVDPARAVPRFVRTDRNAPLRLCVLASGSGTNLEAILDACAQRAIHARVVVVVSNEPKAYALERAASHGVDTVCVDHRAFRSRRAHEAEILARVAPYRPELAVLAGYMRLLTPYFLEAFEDPTAQRPGVINIHPADTRAYQGAYGYAYALGMLSDHRTRLKQTAVTVHFVDAGMDTGPIIAQEPLAVRPDDTLETLKNRGLAVEHRLFPKVIDLIAHNRVSVIDGRVNIQAGRM